MFSTSITKGSTTTTNIHISTREDWKLAYRICREYHRDSWMREDTELFYIVYGGKKRFCLGSKGLHTDFDLTTPYAKIRWSLARYASVKRRRQLGMPEGGCY